MSTQRRIERVTRSRAVMEGAGVRLHRAIGFGAPERFDPFLLLDDFRSDRPDDYRQGFPWHPHRGMETITYVLRGHVEHQDSLGNRGVIGPGDVQWMSAGSGIIHQEMPKGEPSGAMYGFQLWANLPAASKMSEPRYRGIAASEIPVVTDAAGGATIRVIAGRVGDVHGPVRDVASRPEYLDVTVPPGATFVHPTPRGHTVFAYVFEGHGRLDADHPSPIGDRTLVEFQDGDFVSAAAPDDGPLRFLLVAGQPIREPIAWQGPIVMNTQEELELAFAELNNNTFVKRR
jgi:redox-sensitive bicupin YhaK (pirin superfamily)